MTKIKGEKNNVMAKISKIILAIFLISLATTLGNISPAKAAVDQWENITSAGMAGKTLNCVQSVGDYVLVGTNNGLYRSSNRGQNWTLFLNGTNVSSIAIAWMHDGANYTFDSNTSVYIGSNNGIYKGALGGGSWTSANNGLGDLDVRDIEIDQYDAVLFNHITIYAATAGATNSGVYRSDDNADNWALAGDGLAGQGAIKLASDFAYATIYTLTIDNKIHQSTLFSADYTTPENWAEVYDGSGQTINNISIISALGAYNYISETSNLLRSDETGANWTSKTTGLTNTNIRTVTADYLTTNIAYAASNGGGVYKSIDADTNATWTQINKGLSTASIKDIAANPALSTLVYIISASSIYKLELTDAFGLPVVTDSVSPGYITDLTPNSPTANSITLYWTAPGDNGYDPGTSASYDIRYFTSEINIGNWDSATHVTGEPAPQLAGTMEEFTVTGLNPSTTYYFAIKTADLAGNISDLSIIAMTSTIVADTTAPTVIQVTPVATPTTDNTPNYTFNTNEAGTINYSGSCSSATTNALAGNNIITLNSLADGTYSNCGLRVTDTASNASTILTINTFTIDATAPAITNIASSTTAVTSTITWTTNENSDTHIEYGLTTGYGASTTLSSTMVTAHSQTINGLNSATLYHYRVKSKDALGNLATSTDKTFTTANTPDITAPAITNGTPSGAQSAGTTQVTLSVTTNENASCKYSTTVGITYNLMTNIFTATGSTTHSVLITGLTNGTSYTYYIRCQDQSNNSVIVDYPISFSISNPANNGGGGGGSPSGGGGGGGSASTPAPTPLVVSVEMPTGLAVVREGALNKISWNNPVSTDFSQVILFRSQSELKSYYSFDTLNGLAVKVYEGIATSTKDSSADMNLTYYYALLAKDKNAKYSYAVIYKLSNANNDAVNPASNSGNSTDLINAKNLANLTSSDVETLSSDDAEQIFNYNKSVPLNADTRRLYLYIVAKSTEKLDEQDKFAIAYYIHYGSQTTKWLGAGERTGVLNSYLTAFGDLPTNEEEWQDVIKISNGRWPEEKNVKVEKNAQEKYFMIVYKRQPNMKNAKDNAAVTVIAYGLRPASRNMNSEKNAILIFKAIFKKAPIDAVEWDIVRAISYSGAKR